MCWQGDQGYNACAVTPHAAQMSSVIQRLRMQLQNLAMLLLPLAAVMVMHLPAFTGCAEGADAAKCFANPAAGSEAAMVAETLVNTYANTTVGYAHLRDQQTVPVALRYILPPGIRGCFAAAMLGFFISTHTTYLHTWGSIFVQDVLIPCVFILKMMISY